MTDNAVLNDIANQPYIYIYIMYIMNYPANTVLYIPAEFPCLSCFFSKDIE